MWISKFLGVDILDLNLGEGDYLLEKLVILIDKLKRQGACVCVREIGRIFVFLGIVLFFVKLLFIVGNMFNQDVCFDSGI